MNATAGPYNVSLTSQNGSLIQFQQLSGLSSFLTNSTLFYASGLDYSNPYVLTVTNVGNTSLALNGVQITKVAGGQTCVPINDP